MIPPEAQDKILVIKLGALGDFIQALGPMKAIRQHHKVAHITLLTTRPYEDLARSSGYFDAIWLDDRPKLLNIAGWVGLKRQLQDAGFTRVYDLQNNDRTTFYFKLLSAHNRPEWVGAARGASHCNDSPERTKGHAFDGHVQTLALAGISDIKPDSLDWLAEDVSHFPLRAPYMLLVPGSAPNRPEKRWPAHHYARLAGVLHEWGYQPVLLGTAAERDITAQITKQCPNALDLTGQTSLAQLTTLARSAAGCVGNDTGPVHIIAMTGCPTIALFSPASDRIRHAPKGPAVHILQQDPLESLSPEDVLKQIRPRSLPPAKQPTLH